MRENDREVAVDLILKVVEGPADAEWQGLEARFDPSGGLIGRAETARLSLPDPSRTVSRFHAQISCSGDTYFLEEMGSRNAALVNGRAVASGGKEVLRPGDLVRIGRFTLAVDFDEREFATAEIDRPGLDVDFEQEDDSTRIVTREELRQQFPGSDVDLWEAFQEGAGIELDLQAGSGAEFLKMAGQLLRALLGGVHHLSTQRMRLRDEPPDRKGQSRQIDPMRAAAEETRLLRTLLTPGAIGNDTPRTRVREMVDDLTARIAAMRTAVDATVEQAEARLSPAAVEARLERSLLLDEFVPMHRKARLWDLFRRLHRSATAGGSSSGEKASGADGDSAGGGEAVVRRIFNQTFTRAYEQEAARLRKSRS